MTPAARPALAAWDLKATVADIGGYDDEYRTEAALDEALQRGLVRPSRGGDFETTEAGDGFLSRSEGP